MSTETTQETSVVFSEQEQKELRNLNSNLELFSALKTLLTQGLFPGNASVALARTQQFAENLIQQTQDQLKAVEKAASERSALKSEPTEEASNG